MCSRATRPIASLSSPSARARSRSALAAVLAIDVLHHLLAPLVLEIDVDIGRLVALAADEALEQQLHTRRIDLGDAERVADRGVGGRATALAENALVAGVADHVVHGQKEVLVAQLADQCQLLVDELTHISRHALRPASAQALFGEGAQVLACAAARRHQLRRIVVAQLRQREAAALSDRRALGQQCRWVERLQLGERAQVPLAIGIETLSGLIDSAAVSDRRERILQHPARAHMHVHIAARHQWQCGGAAQLQSPVQPCTVVGGAVQLECHPGARGDELTQTACSWAGTRGSTHSARH
jgi:hypothetical protein